MNSIEAQLIHIAAAVVMSFILFVSVDLIFNLPTSESVRGVAEIRKAITRHGGDKAGSTMMANFVCSPDASAGTLLAACGVYVAGIPGGLIAAVFVFLGNKICHDDGYAGTTGTVLATLLITASTYIGFHPSDWIAAMIINIVIIQGISPTHASRGLGALWLLRKGNRMEGKK